MATLFTENVISVILGIPKGKVSTYGTIAAMAGNPRAARQVVRVLHVYSRKKDLPWHRVINRLGEISLKPLQGYEIQKQLLEAEGIEFMNNGAIDLEKYSWSIE
ncbi:MAG: MGMT family protein [Proteobacteria bacterium]|nr:MGMT family protein [Pseudomonadota bacterium]